MKQIYSIAGLTVEMDTTGRTLRQAAPYLSEHPDGPKVELRYDPQGYIDLYPELSSENAEYIATGRSFYRRLLDHDGFMLHSSCVVMDGKAYCFTATSGTGKSTHTALWQKVFGRDRVYILNDDKPALRRMDGRWYAFGTPWSGKYDISVPKGVPLGGIALLSRGDEFHRAPRGKTGCGGALFPVRPFSHHGGPAAPV